MNYDDFLCFGSMLPDILLSGNVGTPTCKFTASINQEVVRHMINARDCHTTDVLIVAQMTMCQYHCTDCATPIHPPRFYSSDDELRRLFNSVNGLILPVSVQGPARHSMTQHDTA